MDDGGKSRRRMGRGGSGGGGSGPGGSLAGAQIQDAFRRGQNAWRCSGRGCCPWYGGRTGVRATNDAGIRAAVDAGVGAAYYIGVRTAASISAIEKAGPRRKRRGLEMSRCLRLEENKAKRLKSKVGAIAAIGGGGLGLSDRLVGDLGLRSPRLVHALTSGLHGSFESAWGDGVGL